MNADAGDRLTIVLVAPRYPPSPGGVERHVEALATRFVEAGHEVTVVSADRGGDRHRRETREEVTVRRCRGLSPGGAFHFAPGVYRAVRKASETADVVHVHNYHALTLPIATAASRAPVVATPHYHGGSASAIRDRLLIPYRLIGRRALRGASLVVAVSQWERERLWADLRVMARRIPNGVDVERFRNAEPVERERPYLLTVGRLEAYKGVQHVIRALVDCPTYDLVVAGDGPYRDDLESIAVDAGVADRVTFAGYVPDRDLPGWYAGASVHVVASSFESYGLTVGEALAAGTPCVVWEAGGLRDWRERDDCVGIDDVDPETIAAAVDEAATLTAPVSSLPTWDDVAERTLDAYRDAI